MRQDLLELVREQYKYAVAKGNLQLANSRSGRRPMSVDTLLRKEKDGTLYKTTETIKKAATESGVPLPGSLDQPAQRKKKPPSSSITPLNYEPSYPANTEDDYGHPAVETDKEVLGAVPEALEQAATRVREFMSPEPVTYADATDAMKRLQKLEAHKLNREDIARAAATGAIVGPLSAIGGGMVTGAVPKTFREGYRAAARPGVLGALRGAGGGGLGVARTIAGAAAGSAIFGASLPLVSKALERRQEEEKLREYLGVRPSTQLRHRITQLTGV